LVIKLSIDFIYHKYRFKGSLTYDDKIGGKIKRKDSKVKNSNNPGKVASMTQTPKKAKGAKMMAMPGKEKKVALKENFSGPDISIEEKLRKNAPIKDYVKDFETSKAPQFKGKSVEKKRNMAVAAHAQKNPSYPMSEMGKKRPSDKEIEAAWEKYRADKKAKGEPIMNVGKTTDINKRRIQNNEDVQVKDSRTIRLTPQVVEEIKKMVRENVAYKINGTVTSFKDDSEANNFKSQNSNVQSIKKI
jgi:hypothetical protein